MKLAVRKAKQIIDDGCWLCIEAEASLVRAAIDEISSSPETRFDAEIKPHREKRSLTANAYAWALITELGNVLRSDKDSVYLLMLKRYGQSEIISIRSDINPDGYFKYFDIKGKGYVNGKEFTHYRVYKGSSEFDSREMAILIDGIISECKEMGIDTRTPEEVELLCQEWGK